VTRVGLHRRVYTHNRLYVVHDSMLYIHRVQRITMATRPPTNYGATITTVSTLV